MSEIDRQEVCSLVGGEGLFEIRGGGFDHALLFRGVPVALLWCDCGGSVAQYLVRSSRLLEVNAEIQHLRQVTDGGFDPDRPIVRQISSFLSLFEDGHYELSYQARLDNVEVVGFDQPSSLFNHRDHFYPFDPLVTTRPNQSLDSSRVEYYQGRIRSGVRPVILVVGGGYACFVLDGHHKLAAYQSLSVPPAVVCIQRVETLPLTPEVARLAFSEAPRYCDDYLNLKLEDGCD